MLYYKQLKEGFMTITEVEEFYNQDQRKYEVVHNRELLNWLKKKKKTDMIYLLKLNVCKNLQIVLYLGMKLNIQNVKWNFMKE